jgi:hypothetical protein
VILPLGTLSSPVIFTATSVEPSYLLQENTFYIVREHILHMYIHHLHRDHIGPSYLIEIVSLPCEAYTPSHSPPSWYCGRKRSSSAMDTRSEAALDRLPALPAAVMSLQSCWRSCRGSRCRCACVCVVCVCVCVCVCACCVCVCVCVWCVCLHTYIHTHPYIHTLHTHTHYTHYTHTHTHTQSSSRRAAASEYRSSVTAAASRDWSIFTLARRSCSACGSVSISRPSLVLASCREPRANWQKFSNVSEKCSKVSAPVHLWYYACIAPVHLWYNACIEEAS